MHLSYFRKRLTTAFRN